MEASKMKYMLLCYDDEQAWEKAGQAALKEAMAEAVELTHEINAKGQYLTAAPLESVSTATCVRVREGKRLVTDGPFAEDARGARRFLPDRRRRSRPGHQHRRPASGSPRGHRRNPAGDGARRLARKMMGRENTRITRRLTHHVYLRRHKPWP